MKTNRLVLLILGLGIFSLVSSADEKAKPAPDENGFLSMFDGKTLKGWEEMPATDKKAWSVKNDDGPVFHTWRTPVFGLVEAYPDEVWILRTNGDRYIKVKINYTATTGYQIGRAHV